MEEIYRDRKTTMTLYGKNKISVEIECSGQSNGEFYSYEVKRNGKDVFQVILGESGKNKVIASFQGKDSKRQAYEEFISQVSNESFVDEKSRDGIRKNLEGKLLSK